MWLNVQNNPQVFRDYVSTKNSTSKTTTALSTKNLSSSTQLQQNQQPRHHHVPQDEQKNDTFTLEQERAAASGFIRSLACRLVLISKIRTKDLIVPKLVMKDQTMKSASTSSSSSSSLLPLAMNGELEFAFKCLSRAGKAMLKYSSSSITTATTTATSHMSSIPDTIDPSAAYSTLSLAIEFWSSLDRVHKKNNDDTKRSVFVDEAFDVMLLLPDCVLAHVGEVRTENNGCPLSQKMSDDKVKSADIDVATRTIDQLQLLEGFVNEQISYTDSNNIRPNDGLKVIQYFLPSVARISYKVRRNGCIS